MRGRRTAGLLLVAVLALVAGGCARPPAKVEKISPAKVEAIAGKDVMRVTLTERAAQRLGIETMVIGPVTATVSPSPGLPLPRPATTVIPYRAIYYDPAGVTWVYTVPEPLTYVREKVVVETVTGAAGTEAVLSSAPPAGTTIVVQGVVELYGAEKGVGK